MAESHLEPRYKAFLTQLAQSKSMVIVKEQNGVKYFKWLTIDQLKVLLGIT